MSENTAAHDIITTAQDAVDPVEVAPGLYLQPTRDGGTRVLDLRAQLEDHYALDHPRRKTGDHKVTDVSSLAAYLAKHGLPGTELWGARDKGNILAVINANDGYTGDVEDGDVVVDDDGQPGLPGWGDHKITLALHHSDDWQHWTRYDGQWMTQVDFAEFVEDHLPNFGKPSGAEALELARSFRATQKVEFGNTQHAGGVTTLTYVETTDAKGGKKGDITMPDTITIALHVYDGGQPYPMTARLRYRVNAGELHLGYKLDRPKDTLQAAFNDVITDVTEQTGRTVWATT